MAEYFSHDYLTREDEKIKNLIYKHGFEGYGLFWAIVEMLYINDGYMQTHYERIAFELRTNKEIIKSIIEDFSLFKIKQNAFTSGAVLHRIKMRKGKSATAKKAAQIRWSKEKANDANAMQTHSESNAIKEKKRKEKKENKIKEIIYPFSSDNFLNIWDNWKEYKKNEHNFKYKTPQSEQASLTELSNLSNNNEDMAINIIMQSMAKGWKGLFKIQENGKQQDTTQAERVFKQMHPEH